MNETSTTDRAGRSSGHWRRFGQLNSVLSTNWWAVGLRGVLAIVFGAIALIFPGITMLSFILVFAAFALVDGVLAMVAAVRAARRRDRWGVLTVQGLVSIAAGVLAFLWPGLTAVAFVLLLAAWAIVSGGLMLSAAFRLNVDHGRWWLALGGFAAMAFGVLLILAPLVGAVVVTWWIGAFAIVHGALLLVLAYRLWSRRGDHAHRVPVHGAT